MIKPPLPFRTIPEKNFEETREVQTGFVTGKPDWLLETIGNETEGSSEATPRHNGRLELLTGPNEGDQINLSIDGLDEDNSDDYRPYDTDIVEISLYFRIPNEDSTEIRTGIHRYSGEPVVRQTLNSDESTITSYDISTNEPAPMVSELSSDRGNKLSLVWDMHNERAYSVVNGLKSQDIDAPVASADQYNNGNYLRLLEVEARNTSETPACFLYAAAYRTYQYY